MTEPLGEETAEALVEVLLKSSGLKWGKPLAYGLGGLGALMDILGDSKEAW